MKGIQLKLHLFGPESNRPYSQKCLLLCLEALVNCNRTWLQMHPETPTLYSSGIVYEREEGGKEDWQDIPTLLQTMKGDCEDLACYRVAELRESGIRCRPFIRWRRYRDRDNGNPFFLYHVLVWHLNNNQLEDPSRVLGMAGREA